MEVATASGDAAEASTDAAVETGFTAVGAGAGVFAIVTTAILVLVQGVLDFSNKSQVAADLGNVCAVLQLDAAVRVFSSICWVP